MAIISTNNARITVKFGILSPIVIDNFDPDSDMWSPSVRQTADGEMTPDGVFNYWGINAPIEAELNVSGGSVAASLLRSVAEANTRRGDSLSQVSDVTVIVEYGDVIEVYYDGIMTGSKGGGHLGSKKLGVQTFSFKFAGKQ